MEEVFIINKNDKGLTAIFKREANIVLASLNKESVKYTDTLDYFNVAKNIINTLDAALFEHEKDIDFVLNTVYNIWNKGLLSPLTLKDDEFEYNNSEIAINKRCHHIQLNRINNVIYNTNAYKLKIRAEYDHIAKKQLTVETDDEFTGQKPIYISKGGVITGECICTCIIRQNIIDKHCFVVKEPIKIPVSKIYDNKDYIYIVDHREPKLKALKEFYNIPIYTDAEIASRKYNLRKYEKLNKK